MKQEKFEKLLEKVRKMDIEIDLEWYPFGGVKNEGNKI